MAFTGVGEVKEALEMLGLSGGNEESIKACVFPPVYPLSAHAITVNYVSITDLAAFRVI